MRFKNILVEADANDGIAFAPVTQGLRRHRLTA